MKNNHARDGKSKSEVFWRRFVFGRNRKEMIDKLLSIPKRLVKILLVRLGYWIRMIDQDGARHEGIVLHKYLKDDGSFDYERYRQIQVEGNKRKKDNIWVIEENIAFLSDYIKTTIGLPEFGICHGTRRGKEQEWFKKYLNCEIIGTEISDTADQFPDTIQWDFHETKPEWIDKADFIYSNSFDHSYDPEKCLDAWMSCIKKEGLCILEHSSEHEPSEAQELDPFKATITLMPYLITTWGKGKYGVRELIKAPAKNENLKFLYFIVIQRF